LEPPDRPALAMLSNGGFVSPAGKKAPQGLESPAISPSVRTEYI
jgi:hypothetical protein